MENGNALLSPGPTRPPGEIEIEIQCYADRLERLDRAVARVATIFAPVLDQRDTPPRDDSTVQEIRSEPASPMGASLTAFNRRFDELLVRLDHVTDCARI